MKGATTERLADHDAFVAMLGRGARLLARRDPVLGSLVREHGVPTFRPHGDYFGTLVDSIVRQQITGRAADSILRKLRELLGGFFEPGIMLIAPDELIRGAGVSPQKLAYLRSLAEHVADRRLELDRLPELPDDEVIRALTGIKGIGLWTAHMFQIFSLGRLDVLPVGDLGVRRGIRNAYGLEELPLPGTMRAIAARNGWAPYRSIAAWYMWRAS